MQGVILAGGRGSRLAAAGCPKPLLPVAGRPLLWHAVRHLNAFGIPDVFVGLGHHADAVVRAFAPAAVGRPGPVRCDTTALGLAHRLTLLDTGTDVETGGRIARIGRHLERAPFVLAWCDGLTDLDLAALVACHRRHGRLATVAAVHPPSRFGHLRLEDGLAVAFREKPRLDDQWINGGFFVVEPEALAWISGDSSSWERDVLVRLAAARQLAAYRHVGFWRCIDTPGDLEDLEAVGGDGPAPWLPCPVRVP